MCVQTGTSEPLLANWTSALTYLLKTSKRIKFGKQNSLPRWSSLGLGNPCSLARPRDVTGDVYQDSRAGLIIYLTFAFLMTFCFSKVSLSSLLWLQCVKLLPDTPPHPHPHLPLAWDYSVFSVLLPSVFTFLSFWNSDLNFWPWWASPYASLYPPSLLFNSSQWFHHLERCQSRINFTQHLEVSACTISWIQSH